MTNADMSSAGRVYQNPSAPRELWFNFGWYIKTMQKFPRYDAHWMGDFINEGHYDEIASNLTKKLAHSNIEQAKLSAFLAHFLVIHGIKLNMRIEFVEQKSGEVGPTWYDSKKEPLRLVAFDRQFGGPPPGCNLVIITDTAVQWPPPPPPPPPVDPSKAAEQPTGAVTGAVNGAVSWVKDAVKGAVGGAKAQSDEVQEGVQSQTKPMQQEMADGNCPTFPCCNVSQREKSGTLDTITIADEANIVAKMD